MNLPQLTVHETSNLYTNVFAGLNRNERAQDGEFSDMENMTVDDYPVMSPRKRRTLARLAPGPMGILEKEKLALITCTPGELPHLIYGELDLTAQPYNIALTADEPKQLVSMGAYLCVFPDGIYVNTENYTDHGSMAESRTGTGLTVSLCRNDGSVYDEDQDLHIGPTPPANPGNGDNWVDTTATPNALKRYNEYTGEWVQATTTYVLIQGVGGDWKAYDGVEISGLATADAEKAAQIEALNGDNIVYGVTTNGGLIIAGMLAGACTTTGTASFKRSVPAMDYVCESGNRIWGCKYGVVGGKTVNEIYCCKLGDFRNWRCYMGLSTDSWAATVGTDGPFTGAVTYRNYPTFFKENQIHRVTGSAPSSYSINTQAARGVMDGSWRSLEVVGETLYYLSRSAVMEYNGALPVEISEALGREPLHGGVGGSYGSKYYLSALDGSGDAHLYVYESARRMWTREDDLRAVGFARAGDGLYCLSEDGKLWDLKGNDTYLEQATTPEESLDWSATFAPWGYEDPNQKYISRVNIRMRLEEGTRVYLWAQYDSSGRWEPQGQMKCPRTGTFLLPVLPARCDHMQIRITGSGEAKIFSVSRIYESGGDGWSGPLGR